MMRKKTAKQLRIPRRTLRTAMVAFLFGLEGELERAETRIAGEERVEFI